MEDKPSFGRILPQARLAFTGRPDAMCPPWLGQLPIPFLFQHLDSTWRPPLPRAGHQTSFRPWPFTSDDVSSAFSPAAMATSSAASVAVLPLPYRMAVVAGHKSRPNPDNLPHPFWPGHHLACSLPQSVPDEMKEAPQRALGSPECLEKVPGSDLRELEQFAASFKSRRIKLGYTQTNVGKF